MVNELGSERPLLECFEFYMKLAVALVALLVAWSFFVKGRKRRLPPGPFPLPIIGNLHLLGELPHQTLAALSLKILDEHVAQNVPNVTRDLVDVLLAASADKEMEIQITRDNIKAILYDMLSAGTDTSSTSIEWAMSELLRNPPLLKKVQDELERVVGMGRMVRESDLPCLPYLQAVVKEALRLHPASPLALPHLSVQACNVLGYEIPKNTRVLVNLWAIGRNRMSWEDAERFAPERFMQGGSMDEKVHNCEWIPFGAGRRGCPGEQLGMLVVEFALAQLLHCFDWTLPDKMIGICF